MQTYETKINQISTFAYGRLQIDKHILEHKITFTNSSKSNLFFKKTVYGLPMFLFVCLSICMSVCAFIHFTNMAFKVQSTQLPTFAIIKNYEPKIFEIVWVKEDIFQRMLAVPHPFPKHFRRYGIWM
jgi:hypothetical protein